MKLKESVQSFIITSLNDPIVKILENNSHLTKTQLETLLIDVLAENITGKSVIYEEKARLRLTRAKISRGSFNRTLKQAKDNAIKSIYTVLLLGYLGIFESTTLEPYIEIANKLQEYIETYKNIPNESAEQDERLKIVKILREELETSLKLSQNP